MFILDICSDEVTTRHYSEKHNMADMVASGKTHNIIGTKLWNMQYGGWLL